MTKEDDIIKEQLQTLAETYFRECYKNEIIYGVFALDHEIPNELRDNLFVPLPLPPKNE